MSPHTEEHRQRIPLVQVFLLVFLAGMPVSRAEPSEDRWEAYPGTLPGVEEDLACMLVRDGRSGRPLPWALASSHSDWTGPDGWGPLEAAARTDEFGLVRLSPSEGVPLWVVQAPGLGAEERYGLGALQQTIDLWPAPEVQGRIVDVRGRPVAGAVVEWTSEESRHGPSLGFAVTDSDGLWRLRVPAEHSAVTLVSGPGIQQTWSLDHAPSWAAPPTQVALPGREVVGRVVGRSDAIGYLMVSCDTVRGPCGAIDADGRFRVPSCEPDCGTVYLHGYTPPPEGDLPWLVDRGPELDPTDWTPGRVIVWDPESDPAAAAGLMRKVAVRVRTAEPQTGEASALLTFDRREDGRRFSHRVSNSEDSEDETVDLPPGTYEARSLPFGEWALTQTVLEVPVEGPAPSLDVKLHRQPRLLIDPPLDGVCRGWAFVATPFGDEVQGLEKDSWSRATPSIHVPAVGDVGITVQGRFGTATAYARPTQNGSRRVELQLPKPAVVSVPAGILDSDVLGYSRSHECIDAVRKDDRVDILLPPGGRVWLDASSFDFESEDYFAGCALEIPSQPGARVDYDRDALLGPPGRSLVIRLPQDVEVPGVPVFSLWTPHVVRSDLDQPGSASIAAELTSRGTLVATSRALCDGAWVGLDLEAAGDSPDAAPAEQKSERWLPARWACHGQGPYQFDIPRGVLDLRLAAPDSAHVAVLVDGDLLTLGRVPASGTLERRVRGLTPGPHVVIVAATACESRLLRFTLERAEERRLQVALSPR